MPSPDRPLAGSAAVGLHLEQRYEIEVAAVSALDASVFKVDKRDGSSWVARTFPAKRTVADVEAEAELLIALEQGGFPAGQLLQDALSEVSARQMAVLDRLREGVERADDCADLPTRSSTLISSRQTRSQRGMRGL